MKSYFKKVIALALSAAIMLSNMIVLVSAEETVKANDTKTQYRYREKIYTTSTEELEEPWILYNQQQVQQCGETFYLYLEEDKEIDTTEYCVHRKVAACKYQHATTMSRSMWVLTSEATNKYGVSHPYYYDYDTTGQTWWHYADGYRYTCCLNSSKTTVTKYYYYQWSEWSDWSETPVTATDTIEVETKTVDLFTITYDANGGTGAPATQVKERDESLTISSGIPSKEGCSFLGWSTTADGAVKYVPGDTYTSNTSVVLYAVWEYPVIASGKVYYNLTWTLFQDGTLVISGDGYMEDCTIAEIPWYSYRNQVKALVIEDGVRAIGQSAFYQCKNMTKVTIKGRPSYIGAQAFAFCENITAVYITDPTAWCQISFGDFCANPMYFADYLYIIDEDGKFIKDVVLDESLTTIPTCAFEKCRYLETIVIPSSVTQIGSNAFEDCENLKRVTFEGALSKIGSCAFYDCLYLTEIEIPEGVTTIERSAFYNCRRLTRVVLPTSIKSIQSNAFMDCVSLKEIQLPKSLTTIESSAFSSCSSLKTVYYSGIAAQKENISIGTSNDYLLNATWYCAALISYNANGGTGEPNSQQKEYGTTITLPDTLPTYVGYVFEGWALSANGEVAYHPGAEFSLNTDTTLFAIWSVHDHSYGSWNTINNENHQRICSCGKTETEAHTWNAEEIIKQPTHTTYGERIYTCGICEGTKTEQIAKTTVHTYGPWVPVDDNQHKSTCACGATKILNHNWDDGIITTPPTNISDGERMHTCKDCGTTKTEKVDKTSVTIDSGICGSELTWQFTADGTLLIQGHGNMFDFYQAPWYAHCAEIKYVIIEEGATSIGMYAFYEHENLISVSIPNTVTSIGAYAFYCCYSLESLQLPNSVSTISEGAFAGCISMAHVEISNNLSEIRTRTFTSCYSLTSVIIPNCVTKIESWAFADCQNLSNITFGSGLKSISYFAFDNCLNLKDVYYTGTKEEWQKVSIDIENTVLQNATFHYNWHEHIFTNYISNNDATCSTIGTQTAKCDFCDMTDTKPEPNTMQAHSYKDYICVQCGAKQINITITNVSLRSNTAGIYFSGNFPIASTIPVKRQGIAVSVYNQLPTADGADPCSRWSEGTTSVLVSNILSEKVSNASNKNRAATIIYARAYVELEDGTYIYSDVASINLQQVVEAADTQWGNLDSLQKTTFTDMYAKFLPILQIWNLPNVKNHWSKTI